MTLRIWVNAHLVIAEATFFIAQRAIDQFLKLLDLERLELKNLRARDERAVHIEERVVSRRPDQPQVSALDVRKKDVLLRFIEMMNLVNEQDRLLSGSADAIRGRGNDFAHLRDVA